MNVNALFLFLLLDPINNDSLRVSDDCENYMTPFKVIGIMGSTI